jgi:phosphatidylglycerophosphatase A
MMRSISLALLTGFWIGRLRPAPGTIGSLPAVLLALIVAWLMGPRLETATAWWVVNVAIMGLGLTFAVVCMVFGRIGEAAFGRKDPPDVVADEIAGQSIALLFLPWSAGPETDALIWNMTLAGTAFVAFRLTDITKPPPAGAMQRLPHGAGILVDDLIAGAYALAITQLMARVIWPLVL